MAGIAYVRKRLYNPEVLVDALGVFGTNGDILKMDEFGHMNPIYEIRWTGTTQAGEELGTAKTATKDGTTTPYLLNIVSSDVADDWDNAAGAVRAVALVGLSTTSVADYTEWLARPNSNVGQRGRPRSTVEVLKTNGVADVVSTRYFIWHDAMYACLWGTGADDATGNIDSEAPTGTVQIRIAAGSNEGEGGEWHFPPGRSVQTNHIDITPTATLAAGDGVVLTGTFIGCDQALNQDPDLNVDYYAYIRGAGTAQSELDKICRKTTEQTSCVWSEALVANAIAFHIHIIQSIHD